MTRIACLYGSGGEFKAWHVERLSRMVRRHAPGHPLVCLTDSPGEVEQHVGSVVRLAPDELGWGWRGAWPKLAAFLLRGPCLYLDLDVTVVRDLSPLLRVAEGHRLVACRGFWGQPGAINASVLGWGGDVIELYQDFASDPGGGRAAHADDQSFIAARGPELWQDLLPRGALMSYKREAQFDEALLGAAVVVVSHGTPRPWGKGGADSWLVARGFDLA